MLLFGYGGPAFFLFYILFFKCNAFESIFLAYCPTLIMKGELSATPQPTFECTSCVAALNFNTVHNQLFFLFKIIFRGFSN